MRTKLRMVQMTTVAASILATSLTANATGVQFESFAPQVCVTRLPPNSIGGTNIEYDADQALNTSTSSNNPAFRYMFCPLSRMYTTSTSGNQPAAIVSDPTGNLWCEAISLDESGNEIAASQTSVSGPGNQQLLNFPTLQTVAWGNVVMFCVLPPGAAINSILTEEFF